MSETADFDVDDFTNRTKSDPKAFVRFFIRPVKNEAKSTEAGRPIYDDKEYCEIMVPGNQTNRPIMPVREHEKARFAVQYARWKASGQGDFVEGTPLSEVTWISRSQVEEFAFMRLRTLEQLAAVGDDVCTRVPGLFDLKRKAQAHIVKASEAAPIEKLQAQIDTLVADNQVKQQTIDALALKVKELEE